MKKPSDTAPTQKSEGGASSLFKNNKEIKKLLDMGVQRGFLTYVEVNELLPPEFISPEAIDDILNLLNESEIEVIDAVKRPRDSEEEEEEGEGAPLLGPVAGTPAEAEAAEEAPAAADVA